ncbi:MAG: SoxR reducing system RseC family protein [Pseudomonadota bacterium]
MTCNRSVEVVSVGVCELTVRAVEKSLCPACQQIGRCRSDWFRRKSTHQTFEIPIDEPTSVTAGDIVFLDIQEEQLTAQILKLYGPPLAGLIVPVVVGQSLGWSEVFQATAAFAGLGLGWLSSRYWTRTFQIRIYQ